MLVKRFPNVCTKANGNIAKSCKNREITESLILQNRTNKTVTMQQGLK